LNENSFRILQNIVGSFMFPFGSDKSNHHILFKKKTTRVSTHISGINYRRVVIARVENVSSKIRGRIWRKKCTL